MVKDSVNWKIEKLIQNANYREKNNKKYDGENRQYRRELQKKNIEVVAESQYIRS